MQAQKKVIPKPEGLRKKQQRDQKIIASLKKQREARKVSNKVRRQEITKKAQQHQQLYQASQKAEIQARRQAKLSGQIYVRAESRLAFVIRIRGVNKLNPRCVRILRLLRLRQLHNGAFVRVNKASVNLLRRVEPYITFGYPSRETIKRLIYKRGFGKVNKQRIPLTNNSIIEQSLGKHGIICIQDLINEIYTVGPHFKQANNFLWPFKLRSPRGGFAQKRHPFQRRGDWGNREHFINQLVDSMI